MPPKSTKKAGKKKPAAAKARGAKKSSAKSASKKAAGKAAKAPSKAASKGAKSAKKESAKKISAAKAAQIKKQISKQITQTKLKLTKASSAKDLGKAAAKLKNSDAAEALSASSKHEAGAGATTPPAMQNMPRTPRPSKFCVETGCESEKTVGDYCRVHYIRNWRKIKRKEVILKERKLNQYVEELVNKYPEKYIEAIQSDLANDRDFSKVVHDLELNLAIEDEEGESDSIDTLLDNIRKDIDVSGGPSSSPIEDDEDLF